MKYIDENIYYESCSPRWPPPYYNVEALGSTKFWFVYTVNDSPCVQGARLRDIIEQLDMIYTLNLFAVDLLRTHLLVVKLR